MAEENETTTGTKTNNPTTTYTINGHIKADDFILKGTTETSDKSILNLLNKKDYTIFNQKDNSAVKDTNIYNTGYIDKELANINTTLSKKANTGYIDEELANINTTLSKKAEIDDKNGHLTTKTYSSSKIDSLIDSLTIKSNSELLVFTKSGNTWTAALDSDSKIITKDSSGNLKLNDGTIESSSLITTSSISFKNNNNKELILKADNNYNTSNLEIILPSKAGTVALKDDIPSFEVDSDGYLNIKYNN